MSKQKTKFELTWIGSNEHSCPEPRILQEELDKSYRGKYQAKSDDNSLQTTALTSCDVLTIVLANNTPPASRQISAPRGVTRFWGIANLTTRAQAAIA